MPDCIKSEGKKCRGCTKFKQQIRLLWLTYIRTRGKACTTAPNLATQRKEPCCSILPGQLHHSHSSQIAWATCDANLQTCCWNAWAFHSFHTSHEIRIRTASKPGEATGFFGKKAENQTTRIIGHQRRSMRNLQLMVDITPYLPGVGS